MMRVMLTSCGLETEQIKEQFLKMLGKESAETKALFIPTAAIDADAIEVLPKCMEDLLKCGIPKENVRVFDLHRNMTAEELKALPGDFTPSAFVAKVTGVDNVCERAALMGAEKLIVHKTAVNGVTVALAAEKSEVRFG